MSVCFSSAAKTSQVEDILQFLPPVFLFLSFIQIQQLPHHAALLLCSVFLLLVDVILVCLDIKVFHTLFLLRLREGQFCLDSVYLIHDGSLADQRIFSQYPGSTGIAGLYRFGQHLSFRTAAQSFMGIQFHPFIQGTSWSTFIIHNETSKCSKFLSPIKGSVEKIYLLSL